MLTAIRQSDSKRVIGYEVEKNPSETYTCEYCGEVVVHHKSKSQVRIGHFKHKNNPYCSNNQKESIDHIKTKKSICDYLLTKYPNSFLEVQLEKWICDKSIRPDIYIETKKGKKIAIEIQASQLTIDQIIKRTRKYTKNDIYVLWVLVWKKSKIPSSFYYLNECYSRYDCDSFCDHSIKLKEMELFMLWMNFKKLVLWDYEKTYPQEGFEVVELEKHVGEDTEFYDESGEYQHFSGRVAKNKKTIVDINFDVHFHEFRPGFARRFEIKGKNYELPDRKQMSWKGD